MASRVEIPGETANYVYEVRSGMAGYGNEWAIGVGQAISQYSQAFVSPSFGSGSDAVIQIDLEKFDVHDFEAHCDLRFTVSRSDRSVFAKTYHGAGKGYAARVVWGGAFAMKSSMRATTDEALRSVFTQFLQDARAQYTQW